MKPGGGRGKQRLDTLQQYDSQTCFKQLLPALQMKGARTANRVLYIGLGNATTVHAGNSILTSYDKASVKEN